MGHTKLSIYQRYNIQDRSLMISKEVENQCTARLKMLNVGSDITTELSHSEKISLIKNIDGSYYPDILQNLASNEGNYDGEEEALSKLSFNKISRGTAKVEPYSLIVDYTIDTDGIIHIKSVEDVTNYLFSGEDKDYRMEDMNGANRCIAVMRNFFKVYEYLPQQKYLNVDLNSLTDENVSISDVITVFQQYARLGFFIPVNNNLNTGINYYYQSIKIKDYNNIPILDYYGDVIDTVSAIEGLTNDELTEKEIEYNIRLPRYTNSIEYSVMCNGHCGFVANGELITFRRNEYYTRENPVYDIVAETDRVKLKRYADDYKHKKYLDGLYVDPASDVKRHERWITTELKTGVPIHNDYELRAVLMEVTSKRHGNNVYLNGGSFKEDNQSNKMNLFIYEKDEKWKDIYVEDYKDESETAKKKRHLELKGMTDRIETSMNIKGQNTSSSSSKYSKSVLNNCNNITRGEVKCLNAEQFNDLTIEEVKYMDKINSLDKSSLVYKNNIVRYKRKEFYKALSNISKLMTKIEDKESYINDKIYSMVVKDIFGGIKISQEEAIKLATLARTKYYKGKEKDLIEFYKEHTNKDFASVIELCKQEYKKEKEIYKHDLYKVTHYEYINELPARDKFKLINVAKKYYKLTGERLEIQNFKIQTINLINAELEEHKEILRNERDKEVKKAVRETDKQLRIIGRALKKGINKETIYRNYETAKTFIDFREACYEAIESINKMVNNEIIKSKYDMNNLIQIRSNLYDMLDKKYELRNDFSMNYWNLNNLCCSF